MQKNPLRRKDFVEQLMNLILLKIILKKPVQDIQHSLLINFELHQVLVIYEKQILLFQNYEEFQ